MSTALYMFACISRVHRSDSVLLLRVYDLMFAVHPIPVDGDSKQMSIRPITIRQQQVAHQHEELSISKNNFFMSSVPYAIQHLAIGVRLMNVPERTRLHGTEHTN